MQIEALGIDTNAPLRRRDEVRLAAAAGFAGSIDLMGVRMRFSRNAEVFGEGEPAEYLYRVVSGAVRTTRLLSDGRRQIGAFLLPGDFFGLEAGDDHRFSAEAIADSVVLVVRRGAVDQLVARSCEAARELWKLTARDLQQAQDHLLLLGRKTAQERLVSFLLDMARRGCDRNAVDLPMPRQDIADYLGLTIETVSRTLTQLENSAAIALPSARRIVLKDRDRLDDLSA